jgi:outer membrane protein assembly factor BamE
MLLAVPRLAPALVIALAITLLCGCSGRRFSLKPYKVNIQQGNFLEAEDIERIDEGMSRSQVRFLLGTPMISDAFNTQRWDYVFYLKIGRTGDIIQSRFTVFFEGDTVARVERPDEAGVQEQIDAAFDS